MDDFADDVSTSGLITIGGVTSGRIDFENDKDWFRIDVANDGDIFNFLGQSVGEGTLYNTRLEIYDVNGYVVNDFNISFQPSQGNTSSEIAYQFVESGTYFVSFTATNFGDYEITTTQVEDDYANGISTTQVLPTTGQELLGELQYSRDQDWFAFDVTTAGEILEFTLTRTDITETQSPFAFPVIYIYDSNGDLLTTPNLRGRGPLVYDFGFSEPGRYYIEVSDRAFDFLQSYNLSAEQVETDDYLDNTNTSGLLIIDGESISGNIQFETDRDWFELNVSEDNLHVQFDFESSLDFDPLLSPSVALTIFTANGEPIRTLIIIT